MTRRQTIKVSLGIAALLAINAASSPSLAQEPTAAGDSVVLRVTSPRGQEVTFSGAITFRDSKTERRLDRITTPFELRLPAQNIDAHFRADDYRGLGGELVRYESGKQRGYVRGTVHLGTVRLYFDSAGSYGFGSRPRPTLSP
jgi:hypothetical protein